MSPATTKIRVRVVPLASGTFHQKVATPSSTSSSLETKDGEGASSVTTVVTVERTHPLYRSDRGVLRHKYDSHASLQQQHQKEASSETSSISSITSVVLIPQESFKLGRIKEEVPATTAPANNGEEVQMRNSLKTKEAAPPPPPSTPPRSKTAASASTSPSSTPNTAQRHHRQSSNRKRFQLRRLHSSSSSINNSSNKTSIMRRISPKRSASGTISDDDDNRSMSSIKRLLTGVSFSDRSGVRSSGSMNSISVQQQQQQQQQCDPMNWGFPGYLTSEEAGTF